MEAIVRNRTPALPYSASGARTVAANRGLGIKFLDALPEDGERRLMLAVLIDAIRTLRRKGARGSATAYFHTYRAWRRECAWMQANNPSQPFSFVSICHALGLDADYVRRRILHPSTSQRNGPTRRYAEKAAESWLRMGSQCTEPGQTQAVECPPRRSRRKRAEAPAASFGSARNQHPFKARVTA